MPYTLSVLAAGGKRVLDQPYALHERAARAERLLVCHGWRGPLVDWQVCHRTPREALFTNSNETRPL